MKHQPDRSRAGAAPSAGFTRGWAAIGALAFVACSQVLGLSEYEIDSSPDSASSVGGMAGQPDAPISEAGEKSAGGVGGRDSGVAEAGHPGAPDRAPGGCRDASDCDDEIDCTTDACLPSGACKHTADDARCDPSKCQTCQIKVGCVPGTTKSVTLLTDPGFDGPNEDWFQVSDRFDGQNIFPNASALSAPNVAQLGPAASGAADQEYADLFQYVRIPERAVRITLSGYYRLAPGSTRTWQDTAIAALYEVGADAHSAVFHEWAGSSGAQAAWRSFSYDAPRSAIADLTGNEYSFDLVASSWESTFYFDSLELTATVCE